MWHVSRSGLANRFEGVPELSVDFEEMLSRARGNFEEQNNILEPFTIIINHFIIIIVVVINACYNCCIIHGIMITLYF